MSEANEISPEKHCRILAGAVQVFAQDGYEGASMSRIAECAGVSKGTLYNYFDGKAELFAALIRTECERHLAHVFDIEEPDGDPATAMRSIGERMLRMIISANGLMLHRLVASEAPKFPALAHAFFDAGPARAQAFMAAWLTRQATAGRLAIPDATFAAEQFFALCQTRIAMTRRLGLPDDYDEATVQRVVGCAVTMFLNTYGARR